MFRRTILLLATVAAAALSAAGAAADAPPWGRLGAPDRQTNATFVRPTLVRSTVCPNFASGELIFTGSVHAAYLEWWTDKDGNPFPVQSLWVAQGFSDVRGTATDPVSGRSYVLRGIFVLPRSYWNSTHLSWGTGPTTITRSDGARLVSLDSVYYLDTAHSDVMFAIRLGSVHCFR